MKPALDSDRRPSHSGDAMTAWQRRAALGMLVGLAGLVNIAFNHAGPSLAPSEWLDWSQAMLGGLIAQACLLAVWLAWGQQPVTVRAPWALGVAALLGLAAAWGEARQRLSGEGTLGELALACLVVLIVVAQALLLLLIRGRWGWQIGASDGRALPAPPRFALRQLLLWTTAAAALLALGRWIAPRQDASLAEAAEIATALAITAPILAVLLLPMVIPSACLALGVRRRGWAAAWLAAMSVVTTSVLFLIVLAMMMADTSGMPFDAAAEAAGVVVPFQTGLVTTLAFGLAVIRLGGFRLTRSANDAEAAAPTLEAPDAPGALGPRSWRPARFAYVAAGFGITVALLVRPALLVEQARRDNLRRAAVQDEWRKLGAWAGMEGERIVSVRFRAGEPIADQALDKLCDPRHAATIRQLDFSGAPLTDEQMERLAGLANLETLMLDGTQITDAGLAHLQGLRRLRTLNLAGVRISDEGLAALENMACLEGLCLNETDVTDAGLAHLRSLGGLISLGLADAQVTDEGLEQLQPLQNLETLLLHGTTISDAGLAHLRELKGLKVVTFQGAQVSEKAAAEFYRTRHPSSGAYNAAAMGGATLGRAVR